MSSFKVKKNVNKACVHCSFKYPYNTNKCTKCKLWGFGTPLRQIPKTEQLYNITNIYVINLQKDKHRLLSFFNNIKKQKISIKNRNWNKFNAVNGSNQSVIQAEANNLNYESRQRVMHHWKNRPGSIGCYFSHINLWKHILNDEKGSEYSLIMEDDSFFTPVGMINIELALKMASRMNWDMLYAGHNLLKGQRVHPLFLKPKVARPGENNIGFNSGLFGYIIRKSSIPKLLRIVSQFNSPFVDVQIRNSFGDGPNNIKALFIVSNLIRHNNTGGSSRKKIDNTN